MEDKLDEIARGKREKVAYLKEYYLGKEGLKATVAAKKETIDPLEAKRARLPGLEVRPLPPVACYDRSTPLFGGNYSLKK